MCLLINKSSFRFTKKVTNNAFEIISRIQEEIFLEFDKSFIVDEYKMKKKKKKE